MKILNNNIIIIILVATVTIFTGCKSSKITQQNKETKITDIKQLIQNTYDAQPIFETMNISNMSMQASYADNSFTFRSSLRIITDSIISLSIQPMLGIEMFRLEFTNNHFAIYDKMNRRYCENNYQYLKYQFGINTSYDIIQAIFTQHLFTLTSTALPELKEAFEIVKSTAQNDTITIIGKKDIPSKDIQVKQRFDINKANNRITFAGVELEDKSIHGISFGEMVTTNQIQFPKEIKVSASMDNKKTEANMHIEKITFNRDINISPINKTRYKKVTVSDILKSL